MVLVAQLPGKAAVFRLRGEQNQRSAKVGVPVRYRTYEAAPLMGHAGTARRA
jgi:hypothetical protein